MIWIKPPTISRVEAVVENPWQIVPVDDPKMSALPEFRLDDIVENPLGNARVS
jgi:hypothetical protein